MAVLDFFAKSLKVKEWLILELPEIVKVPHAVACPIVLFYFMIEVGREECSKFFRFLVLLLRFLGRLRSNFCQNYMK